MGEMHDQSDAQLLRAYAQRGAEAAFAEIVARHADLVYSAALRQVNSPELARDVTQSVFTDLARKSGALSGSLPPEASLVGWLYRGTRFAARDLNRGEIRRTQRESQAMEQIHPAPDTAPDWEQLRPALDDAMAELDEPDRDALLLRYFKNHDLRTVGTALGISDDAAQKRVSRAVERLRELFAKRGVSIGGSGLAVVISAHAVQAAPVGLALTTFTAAVLTGTTLTTTATMTAMTALQKAVATATIAVLAGVGIYEARQASQQREQVRTLKQQQAPLAAQIAQLNQALTDATNQLAELGSDNERLNRNTSELLNLRGQVGMLRQEADELKRHLQANALLAHTAYATSSNSQDLALPQTVAKITVTRIKQPQKLSEELIRRNISVKVGDNFEQMAVDQDVRNLYALGFFSNVRVAISHSDAGVNLNYLLQEKPRLATINFTGNTRFSETDLATILTSKVGESLDERALFRDTQMIQEAYVKSGFSLAKVRHTTRVNEDLGEGAVTFEITE